MDDTLLLEGHPTLPLPFDDRSVTVVVLRHDHAGIPPAERLSVLCEARRVLRPGGELRVVVDDDDEAELLRLADLLGMRTRDDGLAARPRPANRTLRLHKPERRATESASVSLAIPAYSPRFFERCLASAIAQTHANLEIIVCDDSPGGEIEEITQRLAGARQVTYLRNPVRLRGRGNYAKCFAVAGGEFIKFLNDDDVLAPECVQRLVDAFRRAPDIVLATSYRQRIDESGGTLEDQPATRPLVDRDMIVHGISLANVMLMAGLNVVGEPTTTLFRKCDLQQAIPVDFRFDGPDCIGVIDMAMWTPMLLKGDAVYLREPLSRFRIHSGQQQHDPAIQQPTVRAIRSLQAKWLALGLHAHLAPQQLLARPFPDTGGAWQAQSISLPRPQPAIPRWWA